MAMLSNGGESTFTFKALIFGMAIMILMPMLIGIYCPGNLGAVDSDEVLDGYEQMTGQTASPRTSVWVLTGIYTPYSGGAYGYTEDGWLYGTEVKNNTPTQYQSTSQQYTVVKDSNGVFRYSSDSADYNATTGVGHASGELYTSVSMDSAQKSNIFFTEAGKTVTDDGFFYYSYDGYRYSFQPIASYNAMDAQGNKIPVVPTTTSLSLIWYQYLNGQGGLSGNLIISGAQSGLAYLNSAQIISAFNSTTNTAKFDMVFNGISMGIIFKIDPMYLTNGYTVQECYDMGFWSIMVTSQSADASAYTGTDYALNPLKLMSIMVDLFTFNYDDYNMSPWLGTLCSIVFVIPLYAFLLTLCLANKELYILMGVLAAIQAISAALSIFT